ncbi:hypothetical protein [Glycomyces harbinensis]|uniref:Uncharacterized protein n=1 Tax=Glycomyces harbinensis TaxID=58114 RepID=A0A1G6XEK6_9ACTN|nr:hypothetical protein [Glycomyces harbinensis]SDD75797.1 hypothetical protein SAMN05216270_10795 [Glycomyces harbinensis]
MTSTAKPWPRVLAVAAAVLLAAVTVMLSSPAQAQVNAASWTCYAGGQSNNGDADSRDIWGSCEEAGSGSVGAIFQALGEHFTVCDRFPNGHATFAQLTVEGNGTATFYTNGGGGDCDDFDLSFDEGLSVSLKVCTSDTAGATCTRATGGIT